MWATCRGQTAQGPAEASQKCGEAPSDQGTHSTGVRKGLEQLQNLGLIELHVKTIKTGAFEHRASSDQCSLAGEPLSWVLHRSVWLTLGPPQIIQWQELCIGLLLCSPIFPLASVVRYEAIWTLVLLGKPRSLCSHCFMSSVPDRLGWGLTHFKCSRYARKDKLWQITPPRQWKQNGLYHHGTSSLFIPHIPSNFWNQVHVHIWLTFF